MIDFNNVENFKRYQLDDPRLCMIGSGFIVDPEIVYILDDLANNTGWEIIPHWSCGGGVLMDEQINEIRYCFSPWHLRINGCKAVDFHVNFDVSEKEQFNEISKCDFTGIGIFHHIGLSTNNVNVAQCLPVVFHVDIGEKDRIVWEQLPNGRKVAYKN